MDSIRRSSHHQLFTVKRIVYLLIMLALLYGVIPHLPAFLLTTKEVRSINPLWALLSIGSLGASYLLSTGVYYVLSHRSLPYWHTVLIQVAAAFLNRLLPAGSGTASVNYLYLRQQRFNRIQALSTIVLNNTFGLVGNLILLGILAAVAPTAFHLPDGYLSSGILILVAAVVLTLIVVYVIAIPRVRQKLKEVLVQLRAMVLQYRRHPLSLITALALSMGMTLAYASCLFAAAQACGLTVTFWQALIVLSIGVVAATAIPTPGGLGGAEAGLVAGFVGLGFASHQALIAALLYRFVTFWLAMLLGGIAFIFVAKKGYLELRSIPKSL